MSFLNQFCSCSKCWSCKRYNQFALDIWLLWISCWITSNRVHIQKVSISWNYFAITIHSLGYLKGIMVRNIVWSNIYRYFKSQTAKTCFLCVTMMINGLMMIVLPFLRNFGLLITCRCLQNLALGMFITADCRLN